ncbi:MAG: hypothetical protein QMC96_12480 [Methanomicrobiales archaeon]|nr:hypothetical protein [Methanomicrobiales archaeon]
MIDGLVQAGGKPALLVQCISAVFDADDTLDPTASTWILQVVKTILSSPSEKELRRMEGRGIDASMLATVPSTLTIRSEREGVADQVLRLPGISSFTVTQPGGVWTVTIGANSYPVAFSGASVLLEGYPGEVRQYVVADVRRVEHPFAPGLVKNTLYLRELPGRQP